MWRQRGSDTGDWLKFKLHLKKCGLQKKYNKSISRDLVGDIRRLIETARQNVAIAVNTGLTILYWQIGNRICRGILRKNGQITDGKLS